MVATSVAVIVAIVVIDVLAPAHIHLGPLLIAAPAITAIFAGPLPTGVVAGLAVVAQAVIAVLRDRDELFSANHQAQILALLLVGACLVAFCVLRERRSAELRQVRYVSETAQRLILRPLPKKVGPLRVASAYLGAEAEAQIGGDLYAVARTTSSTRLLIGDVRGKGMPPVNDAALLMDAFHLAGHRHAPLPELADHLNASVTWNLAGPSDPAEPGAAGAPGAAGETFITAVLLDIPDGDGPVAMVTCGHPPPIVVTGGRVTTVDAPRPAPPLGLGELAPSRYRVDTFTLGAGDVLLLYTDGTTEARDSSGAFYPLAERLRKWTDCDPDVLLHQIGRDLQAHVGGRLGDDAALIAVERLPAST
ncbi:MAG TPA: PP2C family protein-serine/threonine phosphatase [Streptomyces sp.]|nr:PP2C family protein-serine/threonine phosphatase [Streptomyces sp.]